MSKPKRSWKAKLKTVLVIVFCLVGITSLAGFAYFAKEVREAEDRLPDLTKQIQTEDKTPSQIISDDGVVLYEEHPEHRESKKGGEFPRNVINATLAAEDKRFMLHDGVDYWAMLRTVAILLTTHHASQGGSTITMQVAKRLGGTNEKSLDRKIKNMALAIALERHYSKEQILDMYLNESFFGHGAYGVAAASSIYFGKTLEQLSVGEAATLARCVRNPTYENPISNPEKAKVNRDVVLAIMREEEWITEEEYQNSIKEDLVISRSRRTNLKSPKKLGYIVDYALDEFKKAQPNLDFSTGGYRVELTVDSKLQTAVEEELKNRVHAYRGRGVNIGAFLCMDNEGRIQVMGNSTDYGVGDGESQYNLTTQALLQPGSSFKPVVYSTAFEHGTLSAYGTVNNGEYYIHDRGGKRPIRGEGEFGTVSVRTAVAYSYNRAAMWAQKGVGQETVMDTAKGVFGFKHLIPNVETTPLGSNQVSMYEMVQAYSIFQQKGDRVKPYMIKRIVGPDGDLIQSTQPNIEHRVISAETCHGIDYVLKAVVEEGTGRYAGVLPHVRGKTGTTSDFKDAWFCGYTNRWIGAVWVANQSEDEYGRIVRHRMDEVMGSEVAAPIFARLMQVVQDRYGDTPLKSIDLPTPPIRTLDPDTSDRVSKDDSGGVVDDRVFGPIPDRGVRDSADSSKNSDPGPPIDRSPIENTPPPSEPSNESPAPGNGSYVYVTVCSDSGEIATSKCPSKQRLPFQRGTEPTTRCQLHGG